MPQYLRNRIAGGTYFFTLALADRQASTLVDEIERLRRSYGDVAKLLPFTTIAICVLPDHLHAIWELPPGDDDFSARWLRIKKEFSRGLPAARRSESKVRKREKGIWQRRFWEHRIRDEDDLQRHVDYIHFNPVKHGLVARVIDWPYSSFHRYVRDGILIADWGGDGAGEMTYGEP